MKSCNMISEETMISFFKSIWDIANKKCRRIVCSVAVLSAAHPPCFQFFQDLQNFAQQY